PFNSPVGARTAAAQAVGPCTRTPFWSAIPPSRIFSEAIQRSLASVATVTSRNASPLSGSTRTGLAVLAAALLLGALGDALLRETPWGLNVAVWILALAAAAAVLVRRARHHLAPVRLWLAVPFLFFAVATAWRDSPILKALDLASAAISLALAAALPPATALRRA